MSSSMAWLGGIGVDIEVSEWVVDRVVRLGIIARRNGAHGLGATWISVFAYDPFPGRCIAQPDVAALTPSPKHSLLFKAVPLFFSPHAFPHSAPEPTHFHLS